jgi:TRAP-type C4-dicarboxylate transport system permease small subunit
MSSAANHKNNGNQPKSLDITLLARLNRLMDLVNGKIMVVSTLALLASACILTLGVILRYFLKVPTDWQDETAVFLIVGSIFMCGAYVQSYRGHVGIEAVAAILPAGVNRVRRLLVDIASLGFCTFFAWKSWTLLMEAVHEGQVTSSTFAPPLWIPYGLMALGMTLLTLQILLQIPTHFTAAKGGTE